MKYILDVQVDTYIKRRSTIFRHRKTITAKDGFIREQMTKLQREEITRNQYVKKLGFKFLPKPLRKKN